MKVVTGTGTLSPKRASAVTPSEVRRWGFAKIRVLEFFSNNRKKSDGRLATKTSDLDRPFKSSSVSPESFMSSDDSMPVLPSDANCNPYSRSVTRSTSRSWTSITTSARALSMALMSFAAASIRSGVSLIEIAFVAVIGARRRRSITRRRRSIVSVMSALLK